MGLDGTFQGVTIMGCEIKRSIGSSCTELHILKSVRRQADGWVNGLAKQLPSLSSMIFTNTFLYWRDGWRDEKMEKCYCSSTMLLPLCSGISFSANEVVLCFSKSNPLCFLSGTQRPAAGCVQRQFYTLKIGARCFFPQNIYQ